MQFVRMMDINFNDIALRITIDRGLSSSPSDQGQHKKAADSEVLGSVLSYRLRSFSVRNEAAETYGVLLTDISLQGLSIDCTQPDLNEQKGMFL